MRTSDAEYMANYIAKELVGWKITGTITDPDGENYGFIVKKGKAEKNVWVSRDEEGNGPGFLEIETQSQAMHSMALIDYVNVKGAIFEHLDNLELTEEQKSRVREIYEHDFRLATSGPYVAKALKELNQILGEQLEKLAVDKIGTHFAKELRKY
jgi:hypothetical protein